MTKKIETVVQEDAGAQQLINDINEQLKPKKQVATVYFDNEEYEEFDDIIGYSGAENWFVIQKRDGTVVFNRSRVFSVEIEYKDVE